MSKIWISSRSELLPFHAKDGLLSIIEDLNV